MKRSEKILWVAFLSISGFIGFTTHTVNTATANDNPVIPRFTDVPRTNSGFDLNIDLNSDDVVVKRAEDINITIQKKDSIVYVPSFVEKPIIQYVKVTEMPPMKQPKVKVANFTKGCFEVEKINLHRN